MTVLPLVYAPNPIFKKHAQKVEKVDDEIRSLIDSMYETLEFYEAVGLGANMVGVLKRIAVVNLHEDGVSNPRTFINPEITWRSEEIQENEEASICFLGISAKIKRPNSIELSYLDYDGKPQKLKADGFLATVIQHEVDYLDGITFPDHLSKLKKTMLLQKMQKFIKQNPPPKHGEACVKPCCG